MARILDRARATWRAPLYDPDTRTITLLCRDGVLTMVAAPFVWLLLALTMAVLP